MMQEKEMSHAEKMAMYMKLSKRELAEMLISANTVIKQQRPIVRLSEQQSEAIKTLWMA